LLLAVATAMLGAVHDPMAAAANARGFEPEKLYQFNGIDSVNLFNGNVTLSLPIGGTYPVDGDFSYGLTLYYNSKVWHFDDLDSTGCSTSGGYAFPAGYGDRMLNAGLGWTFDFGRIVETPAPYPLTYLAPDGAEYKFQDGDILNDGVYYSPDLASLRLKFIAGPANDDDQYVLELGNGSVHTFKENGEIVSMRDQFGNSVDISDEMVNDENETADDDIWRWKMEDAHGKQTIDLKRIVDADELEEDDRFAKIEWMIDTIEVRAFSASGTDAAAPAVYRFEYADTEIKRACASATAVPCADFVKVLLLTTLELPDGSQYQFEYDTDPTHCFATGTMTKMTLPTGGAIGWEYDAYLLPTKGCDIPSDGPAVNATPGVSRKSVYDANGNAAGVWSYRQFLAEPVPVADICPPDEEKHPLTYYGVEHSITAVTDPFDRTTRHYFAAWSEDNVTAHASANQRLDYGLPFTRVESVTVGATDRDKRYLSREVCATGTGKYGQQDCVVLRSVYVAYDGDIEHQPRLRAEYTKFGDDPEAPVAAPGNATNHFTDWGLDDYDGYGNYRTRVETSSFGPKRVTFTDYYKNADGFPETSASPWILNRFKTQEVRGGDGSVFSKTNVCFGALGQLLGKRWLAGTGESTSDLVVRYGHDDAGNTISEAWYGGDRTPLPSSDIDLCTFTAPAESTLTHTYTAGVLATTRHSGLSYFSVDATIDAATGLVRSSRDSAGVETRYFYDASRRLTLVQPDHRAETKYCYRNASATMPCSTNLQPQDGGASVLITRGPSTDQGTAALVEYDAWGRVRRESTLMPDGIASHRVTTLDVLGRRTAVTELGRGPNVPATSFVYDRFDRVTEVTSPDSSETTFAYARGVRERTRTVSLALPDGSGTTTATTTETYDALGRLARVAENAGSTSATDATGEVVRADYQYDLADRLVSVSMGLVDQDGDIDSPQLREFDYDGRGFLTREQHPESGETTYTYDWRGNVYQKNAPGSAFDLELDYDQAGRLTVVKAMATNEVLKRFEFSPMNGRLTRATRMNYAPAGTGETIRVREEYGYDDAGRINARTTSIAAADDPDAAGELLLQPISQAVEYDTLDREQDVVYPRCEFCGVPAGEETGIPRTVESTYRYGRLYSVPGFIASTTYSANGLWSERIHANGVKEVQESDDQLARPKRIQLFGLTTCPSIALQPQDDLVNDDETAQLSVATSDPNATFQWYMGVSGDTSNPIATATGSTLIVGPLNQTTSYWCRVSGTCTADTRTATVWVCQDAEIQSPPTDASWTTPDVHTVGTVLPFQIGARGDGITYSWYEVQLSETGANLGQSALPSTGPSQSWTVKAGLWAIDVVVTGVCDEETTTERRRVAVIRSAANCAPAVLGGFRESIEISPSDNSIDLDLVLDIPDWDVAKNSLIFSWFVDGVLVDSDPGQSTFHAIINSGKLIRVEVTGPCSGGAGGTFKVVRQTFVFRAANCPAPPLSVDQREITHTSENKTFHAHSDWPTVHFTWYRGDSGNTRVKEGEGPNLTVTTDVARTYWVRATSSCGSHTDGPTVRVRSANCGPIEILQQPASASAWHAGNTHTLAIVAEPAAEVETVTWYEGRAQTGGHIIGYGSSKAVQPQRTTSYFARVKAKNNCGFFESALATVHVTSCDQITVTQEPQNAEIQQEVPGSTALLEIDVTSSHALEYQWFQGAAGDTSMPLEPGRAVTVKPAETTTYWVLVSIAGGCAVERTVTVTVCQPLAITGQPAGSVVPRDFKQWLRVQAMGSELSYQWYRRNSPEGPWIVLPSRTARDNFISADSTADYKVRVTSSCAAGGSIDSEAARVSVPPGLLFPLTGGPVTKGSVRTLDATADGTFLQYQWYRGDDDTQPLAGEVSATFTTPAINDDVTYWVRVRSGDAWIDASATFTVCQPRGVTVNQPSKVSGSQVLLGVDVTDPNEFYEWYQGETGDTTTFVNSHAAGSNTPVTPTVTTKYWLRTKRGTTCDADSTAVTVMVCKPRINTQPVSQMINSGATATLSVAATGDPTLTWQWYRGESGITTDPIAGATSATYTTPALTTAASYWVAVSNQPSACTDRTTNSATASITICTPPNITSDPVSKTSTPNAPVSLSVAAVGTAPLSYQWYRGGKGVTTNPIANGTGTTLNIAPSETTNYWVRVTGPCSSDDSGTAKVSIPAGITTQPAGGPVTKGSTRTLSVVASGTELTYQWYDASSNPISGATSATYTTPALQATTSYWVRVMSGWAQTDSAVATLTVCSPRGITVSQANYETGVQATLQLDGTAAGETYEWYRGASGNTSNLVGTGTVQYVSPTETTQYWVRTKRTGCDADSAAATVRICSPRIDSHPQSTTIESGHTATLTVSATGPGPLNYYWFQGEWLNMSTPVGTNSPTFTTPALTSTTKYWVRVMSPAQAGCTSVAYAANVATVTVCNPPSITAQPQPNHISSTQSVTLGVTATGTGLSYQWYQGASGVTTTPVGTNSSTLTVTPGSTKSYWVRVTGSCGGAVNSSAALQSVVPVFTTSPAGQSVCSGQSVTLSAVATGDPATITYQWYRRAVGASAWTPIGTNSTTCTLTITAATEVKVDAASGTATSQAGPVTLSVLAAPDIYSTTVQARGGDVYRLTAGILVGTTNWGLQWYQGALGNTSYPYSQSNPTDVYAPTRPQPFWIRVTDYDNGCYADKLVTVQ
jgi:hypothetical protein